jgi:hypothetical protein
MTIGSRDFLASLVALCLVAAATGFEVDSRPLIFGSIVVGACALHLTGLRTALRDADPERERLESERLLLAAEREQVRQMHGSLEERLARAERQFDLLCDLVAERVRRPSQPDDRGQTDRSPSFAGRESAGVRGPGLKAEESHRGYGRW